MAGVFTGEQVQFAEAVARFVAREYATGPAAPRPVFDRARYRGLGDLGCLALAVPESRGGIGGAVELVLASAGIAPALAHEPFLASGVHAAALIAAAADADQAARWLPPLLAGERIVGVAHTEHGVRDDRLSMATTAVRSGRDWILSGRKPLVAAAPIADAFVVATRSEADGTQLFLVESSTPGLECLPRNRLDGYPAADLHLTDCRLPEAARLSGASPDMALAAAADIAELAEAAAMVGIMDAGIRATVDYLRTRQQFGVPLATFQVLQHRLADMWIACEEARSLAYAAAFVWAADVGERHRAVSMAKVRACDAAHLVGAEMIQLHGGIGMTDDLAVSHWYKRLLTLRMSFHDRRYHIARLTQP